MSLLEAEERLLSTILRAASDHAVQGVLISSSSGEIVYANEAMATLVEFDSPEELIGEHISRIVDPSSFDADAEAAKRLLAGEIHQHVSDKYYVTQGGEKVLISAALSVARLPDSGDFYFVGHVRDVREERRTSQALEEARARAEEATRLKSEFLANMSHEIRTPLNGVIGMTQVLAKMDLNEEQAEIASVIHESGTTLMALLSDILDLSKIEAGKLDVSPVAADLRHKLRRVEKIHTAGAAERGLDLQFVFHPSVPALLSFDPVRVRQCVENLVSNAVKFTRKGRVLVAVASEPAGDDGFRVTVHVSDTGIGISREKQAQIFEVFEQADGSTTRNFGGSGLGLSISRRLARMMGGDLTVVSEEGRGSIFTFTFIAGAAAGARPTNGVAGSIPSRSGTLSGRRALVVDDNEINRRVASSFLSEYGFETVDAADGVEALERMESETFDLVLMDIHMPNMDGLEALRRIRETDAPWRDVPVVALTADAMIGDRTRYLDAGMDGYVAKPIQARELLSEIGLVLAGLGRERALSA